MEITQAGKRITRDKIFLSSPRDADAAILYPSNAGKDAHDTRRLTSNKLPVNLGETSPNMTGSSGALYLQGIPPDAVKDRKRLKEYQG